MTTDYVGFCWHVHPAYPLPLEWCHSFEERLRVIMLKKPKAERPAYLKRFQRATWPNAPQDVADAAVALDKASTAWDKAITVLDKTYVARLKAYAALSKAHVVLAECLEAHRDEILALHREQCVDCPWEKTGDILSEVRYDHS